ncbi:HPr family phosphocarrier protein [Salinifilum aidingensis]
MRRRVTVASRVGLHARPAGLLAQTVAGQAAPVRIAKVADGAVGEFVDAASVLGLMTLGAEHGAEVELDSTDEAALDAAAAAIATDQDAEAPAQ